MVETVVAATDPSDATQPGKKKKKKRPLPSQHDAEGDAKPVKKKLKKAKAAQASRDASAPTKPKADAKPLKKKSQGGEAKKASNDALTVIIGGLPFKSHPAKLSKDFAKCGKIKNLNMPKDTKTGLARGFAFITFATQAGVDAALEFDGKEYKGRRLTARRAGEKPSARENVAADAKAGSNDDLSIFVASLPHDISEKKLRKHFSSSCDVAAVKLPLNDAGQPKGFAFVTLKDAGSVEQALSRNGSDLGGRSIVVRKSGGEKLAKGQGKSTSAKGAGKGQGKSANDLDSTVFVSGLPYYTTEEKLRKIFSECGTITTLKLPMCSWDESQSRGFAFISYTDKAAVGKALQMDGKQYEDRYMSVKKAVQHEEAVKTRDKRKENKAKAEDVEKTSQPIIKDRDDLKTDRERGAIQKSEGKQMVFESDDEDE
eukprot:TRINITY_DN20071_c0_g1_i1.p1 TRINITY_DN20071_c0_g1~~TRINITY_DN20071_c0_g1_i1.p1  ORF type:complete len:428 (-),score=79.36 TRINITY_DN20071_c0_g1_i1:87-1370(-)